MQEILGHFQEWLENSEESLENFSSEREMKDLIFCVEKASFLDDKDYAEENCQKHADEGWTASTYFRSQSSIQTHDDGKRYAHGSQHRYVDAPKEEG